MDVINTPDGNIPVVPPVGQDMEQGKEQAKQPQNQTEGDGEDKDTYVPFKEGTEVKQPKEIDDEGDGEGDEDVKLIKKEAKKVVAPISSNMQSIEAELSANAFLSRKESEVFLPYADQIRAVAKDPRTKNLPMEAVVAIALGPKKLMKLGADMERAAASQASQSVSGGGNNRSQPSGGIKNAWDLSDEEFNKTIAKHRL